MDDWILTYTGRRFYPLTPRAEDVDILDIAHALSLICRFNGHVRSFYSVAQHCVLGSYLVYPPSALAFLLHDAGEAYLCDVPRPVKQHLLVYRNAERALDNVIRNVFRLPLLQQSWDHVHEVDDRLLLTERRDLMPAGEWLIDETRCYAQVIDPWSAPHAEAMFLRRYAELRAKS